MDELLPPAPPWTYLVDPSSKFLATCVSVNEARGGKVIGLSGERMTNVDGIFREFAGQLSFPNYFGSNWPALDECLADLEWLPATSYILIIRNAEQLMQNSDDNFGALLGVLSKVGAEWSKPVIQGEYWDRGPVSFHCLLLAQQQHHEIIQNRGRKSGHALPLLLAG